MRIAYFLSSDIARYLGSTLKIKDQVEFWKERGHTVEVFCLSPDLEPSPLQANRYKKGNPVKDKFLSHAHILNDIETFEPDVVYIRYSLPSRDHKVLQNRYPSVIEINTDDTVEYKTLYKERSGVKNYILWKLNSIFRATFLKRASGLISVTHELAGRDVFKTYNSTITVVPNGIRFPEQMLKSATSNDGPVKLFFIGAPGLNWHGTDQIALLAKNLGHEVEIHIVGEEGENQDNLKYYGYLTEDEYLPIMEACDVCLGSFSLYQKQLFEACTLKVRKYISGGFPVILGHKDSAFLEQVPSWILELPNKSDIFQDQVNVDKVLAFCKSHRSFQVPFKESKPLISLEATEDIRLQFLESII